MNKYIDVTRSNLPKDIQALVDEDELKESVLSKVEEEAMYRAAKEIDLSVASIPDYKGINIRGDSKDEYLMVLEFLESLGLKFSPSVLKYESQHPEIFVDRKELAEKYRLKSHDRTPLLVQLFQDRLNQIKK